VLLQVGEVGRKRATSDDEKHAWIHDRRQQKERGRRRSVEGEAKKNVITHT
jgi:hypothetical protein